MSNDLNNIDPIGESLIDDIKKDEQLEHDLICNTGTAVDRLKKEIDTLNEMIKGYETYSGNTLFINQLKNLKQRMLIEITAIDRNFNNYVDYSESLKSES